jgi:hypothetical protein
MQGVYAIGYYIKLRMQVFLNHKTKHKLIGPVSAWNESKKIRLWFV